MNVLFLVRTLAFGGAERQLVALARGLHERGHHVRIMVFYPGGPLEPEARAAGIPIISVDKRGRWDLLGFFWRVDRSAICRAIRRTSIYWWKPSVLPPAPMTLMSSSDCVALSSRRRCAMG